MTELRQLMHQAVDHHYADHVGLVVRARRGGSTLRRHRLVVCAASSVAVVALLVCGTAGVRGLLHAGAVAQGGAAAVLPGHHHAAVTRLASLMAMPGARLWRLHRARKADATSTAYPRAAHVLAAAVAQVTHGAITGVRGYRERHRVVAGLTLASGTATAGAAVTAVWIPAASAVVRAWRRDCLRHPSSCHRLVDGSLVRTRSHVLDSQGATTRMNVVERSVHGELEVLVAASPPDPGSRHLRRQPVLSTVQLLAMSSRLAPLA